MLGDGYEEVSIVTVVYPSGTIIISSLGYFVCVGSSSKPSHPSFYLSIGARHTQDYFKKKRGEGGNENSLKYKAGEGQARGADK